MNKEEIEDDTEYIQNLVNKGQWPPPPGTYKVSRTIIIKNLLDTPHKETE